MRWGCLQDQPINCNLIEHNHDLIMYEYNQVLQCASDNMEEPGQCGSPVSGA
jgi:hypothetical protein